MSARLYFAGVLWIWLVWAVAIHGYRDYYDRNFTHLQMVRVAGTDSYVWVRVPNRR